MDPLADVLELCRVRGALAANVRAHAPWGLEVPRSTGASFHVITSGTAWLRAKGAEPAQLMPGDLLLLPTGAAHRLSSEPDGRCRRFDRRMKEEEVSPDGLLQLPGSGATTTFVCAGFDYEPDAADLVFARLPQVLHVPADPVDGRDIAMIVELVAAEAGRQEAGARAAATRLIELLLIAAIRRSAVSPELESSWLGALRDPLVGRALAVLHDRPGDRWTLEALAREVHVSRATLARRFTDAVGEPPLSYLNRWRMQLAAIRLRRTSDTIATIAHDVGYRSEYAFNRAFARHRGTAPGRFRRLARAG